MRFGLGLLFVLSFILVGCGPQRGEVAPLETQAITTVAWSERIVIKNSSIPASPFVAITTSDGKTLPVVSQGAGRVVFDLPASTFPYTALPTSTANYKNRGTVTIKINGKTIAPSYQPFGEVVSGQLSVLVELPGAPNTCLGTEGFYSWLHGLADFDLVDPPPPVSGESTTFATNVWCYATVSFSKLGTADAIASLQNLISAKYNLAAAKITMSRNVVFSSDGENSYDPGCNQIRRWLDPYATGYQTLDATGLKASVNAGLAHAANIKGNGVTVALMGGGVNRPSLTRPGQILPGYNFLTTGNPQDDFQCDLDANGQISHLTDFLGHDTWVAETINTIAPLARIDPLKVCDAEGKCPSGKITQALIYVLNTYVANNQGVVVHMSLGGPLENKTQQTILTKDSNNPVSKLLLVASAGNGGRHAGEHYPASYAEGLSVGTGVLENVVSIGAMGKTLTNTWQEADFTIDGNYNLLASGVNNCPKATTFRCNATTPHGFNGTSFSAPLASGVAALYAQRFQLRDGTIIRNCLVANTMPAPAPTVPALPGVWYNPSAVCP
jgi:hypothetical protein